MVFCSILHVCQESMVFCSILHVCQESNVWTIILMDFFSFFAGMCDNCASSIELKDIDATCMMILHQFIYRLQHFFTLFGKNVFR
jgi:hypothetical protein